MSDRKKSKPMRWRDGLGTAALSAAVAWGVASCGGAPPPPPPPPPPAPACDRTEGIQLQLASMPQLNPDREGYSRSVVVRVYQLESAEAFDRASFDELWPRQADGSNAVPAVVLAHEEVTLIPGRSQTAQLKRHPKAAYLGVTAKFREHHPESGWRASTPLPTPRDPCQFPTGPRLSVELLNYALRFR